MSMNSHPDTRRELTTVATAVPAWVNQLDNAGLLRWKAIAAKASKLRKSAADKNWLRLAEETLRDYRALYRSTIKI